MAHWSLDDIPWQAFDATKVRPDLACLAKAACMVEHNGQDYARYLCEVFAGDVEFQQIAMEWAAEEVQHGKALRKWAELADPAFDFDKSFKVFTEGYKLPVNVASSVRGSRAGELIARCVVETGTSAYYTAIKEASDEPVLKEICAHIAADEFRHYKLFYTALKKYLAQENIGTLKRLKVALGRITESEDDELAYAFYAAHNSDGVAPYNHKLYSSQYLACAYGLYREQHVQKMTAMVLKAVGVKPYSIIRRMIDSALWRLMQRRTVALEGYRNQAIQAAA